MGNGSLFMAQRFVFVFMLVCIGLVFLCEVGLLGFGSVSCLFVCVCVCVREGGRWEERERERECITWRVLPITPLSWRSRRREGEILSFFFPPPLIRIHCLPGISLSPSVSPLLSCLSPNLPIFSLLPPSLRSSLYLPSASSLPKARFSPTQAPHWFRDHIVLRQRNAGLSSEKVESGSTFF